MEHGSGREVKGQRGKRGRRLTRVRDGNGEFNAALVAVRDAFSCVVLRGREDFEAAGLLVVVPRRAHRAAAALQRVAVRVRVSALDVVVLAICRIHLSLEPKAREAQRAPRAQEREEKSERAQHAGLLPV